MAAKRGDVSFILSVGRLIGCRGGGGYCMLRSAVLETMENGARRGREEEKKKGGKRLVLCSSGSCDGNGVAARLRGSSMASVQEGMSMRGFRW
jgi:hypothetical protein